jgi:predicted RNA-binding Zn ribbon-like protein
MSNPAPGSLETVRSFVNTLDIDDGIEQLGTPAELAAWLAEHGLADDDGATAPHATAVDLRRAIELREALRALCLANHDGGDAPEAIARLDEIADDVAPAAGLTPSLGSSAIEAVREGPDAACALALGIVLIARVDGTFHRLKACPHERCGWAFYDVSRNRSSQWCSMRICGNRTKGEAFRRRHSRRPT